MIFFMACAATTALPLASQVTTPLSYVCHHVAAPPVIDGKLDDAAWRQAPWTTDFVDITGDPELRPLYRTRMKMLWDDHRLYIAAELQEPDVHGTLTAHDSVIFHDNDFELFLKPVPAAKDYFEYEINALNTTWDLYLNRPYLEGGKADSAWEATGIKTAVAVQGTLNKSDDKDKGWTLEIALPLDAFATRQQVTVPTDGTQWRVNFSRVEWLQGHPREENWVWSPQGAVNMHIPDRWGTLTFRR
ncbi:carbohydrate-binding family 9-like protein [Terriglobus roseus]|uniref:carbohydrate-binding family 9-like protein n=1 Tax=Terriglobus roseus TaxID=392734 RepID=UPI001FCD8D84|nr:carbohydrate-binding family 9-like protein [Terriglobus roseus]